MQAKTSAPQSRAILRFLASKRCFQLIVGLLIVQALWIALTGRYPMAFDEDFHLGIIRLYAHHLSPFWGSQPPHADAYGEIIHDPSYLYHYLMSFPYRLIALCTQDQTIQVIILRLLNIGLFASGLVLFRRLLATTGASLRAIHISLLVFVLLPVVPLLAAQINYDNLLFPLVALSLLLTLRLTDELRAYKRISGGKLLQLGLICLLTSLVKLSFLPIFVAIIIYLLICLKQAYRSQRKFWFSLAFGLSLVGRRARWVYLLAMIVSLGLFTQRYGVNLVRYHTPDPGCAQVLSVQRCSTYGPWIRDYTLAQANTGSTKNPFIFGNDWLYGMWLRTYFAVDGPGTGFQTRGPLLVPGMAMIAFGSVGLLLAIYYGRRLWRRYGAASWYLLALSGGLYVVALWLDEYSAFVRTGRPVAINGRYLVPVILPLILLLVLAFSELVRSRPRLKLPLVYLVLICCVWGGGVLTYILRSNSDWYWPNQTVRNLNYWVQETVGPLTPGYRHPTEFLH